MTIPKAAIDLILESEGVDQPGRWPGGGSGITLGYGCDIGADPKSLDFWNGILTDNQIERLAEAKGKTGRAAAQIQTRFSDIKVTKSQSLDVFMRQSLPREIAMTAKAFPGSDKLPGEAFGALVSLVYNRGTQIDDSPRRKEMLAIRQAIKNSKADPGESEKDRVNALLKFIAAQFRGMKRLWQGKGLDGLLRRRDAESQLVLSALVV